MKEHPQNEFFLLETLASGELEIDGQGQVWRIKKRTYDRWTAGVKVTPCRRVRAEMQNGTGYLQIRAMRDRKRVYAAAHRLVFLHFKGAIPQGMTINHRDGNKTNNHPDNLELATYSQQRVHAIQELGAAHWDCAGERHPKRQATDVIVLELRRRRALGQQVKALAAEFGMKPKAVSAICRRKTWAHLP